MKYYTLATLTVTDRAWTRDYVRDVTPMVERHGGRYLARTNQFERLEGEGDSPHLALLIEWPSREAALQFYESEAYRPYRTARLQGAQNEFYLVAGEDVNQVARIEQ
ncbi:DUF1330 domain-containing protein [Oxalobacteraceae bacterium OM1]|nr:DUF1330 domain-containing protein [Oxalobacteraceae bacterium OM1]